MQDDDSIFTDFTPSRCMPAMSPFISVVVVAGSDPVVPTFDCDLHLPVAAIGSLALDLQTMADVLSTDRRR